jgi:ELWxxDGT repeat protein
MLFYAVTGDPAHGIELWATDGTAEGTGMLGDINPGPGNGLPRVSNRGGIVFGLGDRVYFVGSDGASGDELWAYRVRKE